MILYVNQNKKMGDYAMDFSSTQKSKGVIKLIIAVLIALALIVGFTVSFNSSAATNCTLSTLTATATGTWSPSGFTPGTYTYTLNVSNATTEIRFTPTQGQGNSTIKVNGTVLPSGTQSQAIALSTSSSGHLVSIEVSSTLSGYTTKTYNITVKRAKSSNNDLSNLTYAISPLQETGYGTMATFDKNTIDYYLNVRMSQTSITFTPTLDHYASTMKVNNVSLASGATSQSIDLTQGENIVEIAVTAENGSTKIYTIYINRNPNTDPNLITLTSDVGKISPTFTEQTAEVTIFVSDETQSIMLTPTLHDHYASFTLNGSPAMNGAETDPIPLIGKKTIITIVGTAEDGVTTFTYHITVDRVTDIDDSAITLELKDIETKTLELSCHNFDQNSVYQVWCYENWTDEYNVDEGPYWRLIKTYSDAFDQSLLEGAVMGINTDGSAKLTFSVSGNLVQKYKIIVRAKDQLNRVSVLKDEFDLGEVGFVRMETLLIDDTLPIENIVKNANTNMKVTINAIGAMGNNNPLKYEYFINDLPMTTNPSDSNILNYLIPTNIISGKYTIKAKVYHYGDSSNFAEKTIDVYIYNGAVTYPELTGNCINIPGTITAGQSFNLSLAETLRGVNDPLRAYTFSFNIPFASTQLNTTKLINQNYSSYQFSYPGRYQIYGQISNENDKFYSDGAIRTVNVERNASQSTKPSVSLADATFKLNDVDTTFEAITNTINANSDVIKLTASASNSSNNDLYEYCFLRKDAIGTRVVKDWGSISTENPNANTLDWAPKCSGTYYILVRARLKEFADEAGASKDNVSFEDEKQYKFDVQGYEQTISSVGLTVTPTIQNTLEQIVKRTPVVLTASCDAGVANPDNLLYKFVTRDEQMESIILQDYTPFNTCTWVPRKAGTYTVLVRVKDRGSFGFYDMVYETTITVGEPD